MVSRLQRRKGQRCLRAASSAGGLLEAPASLQIIGKLTSLPFQQCAHRDIKVDAQPSLSGGVLVFVTGFLQVSRRPPAGGLACVSAWLADKPGLLLGADRPGPSPQVQPDLPPRSRWRLLRRDERHVPVSAAAACAAHCAARTCHTHCSRVVPPCRLNLAG